MFTNCEHNNKMHAQNVIYLALVLILCFSFSQTARSQSKEEVKQKIAYINEKYKKQKINLRIYDDGDYLEVEFAGSTLTSIPKEVFEIKRIQSLLIKSDSIFRIQDEIFAMPGLISLRMLGCKIDSLPDRIIRIKTLQEIAINYNPGLRYISPQISKLPIAYLQFAYDSLKQVPPVIFNCTQLKSLVLNGNQLKIIPTELQQLSELTNLEIDVNRVQYIPREVGKLSNLQRLYMSDNQIKFIPKEVFTVPALLFLKLNNNQIDLTNSEFIKCANPKLEIQLLGNNIYSIPDKFNQLELTTKPKY